MKTIVEATKRAGFKAKKVNGFAKGSGCYTCACCKKMTRSTGRGDNENVGLCAECYDKAGDENAVSDGMMTQEEFDARWNPKPKAQIADQHGMINITCTCGKTFKRLLVKARNLPALKLARVTLNSKTPKLKQASGKATVARSAKVEPTPEEPGKVCESTSQTRGSGLTPQRDEDKKPKLIVKRKLPVIPIDQPQPSRSKELPAGRDSKVQVEGPFPMHGAIQFIQAVDAETSSKKKKFLILEKHLQLFEKYPSTGTKLEVARARCIYRLQFLGHTQTKTFPSPKFLQNYNALMKFSENDPWNGCTSEVAELGKFTSLSQGEVSMAATKAVSKVVKSKKTGSTSGGNPTRARSKVLGKYAVTHVIAWMAHAFEVSASQIEVALQKLKADYSPSTVKAYSGPKEFSRGKYSEIVGQDKATLKGAIPAEVPKATKAKAVPAKTVAKVVKKLSPKPVSAKPIAKKIVAHRIKAIVS